MQEIITHLDPFMQGYDDVEPIPQTNLVVLPRTKQDSRIINTYNKQDKEVVEEVLEWLGTHYKGIDGIYRRQGQLVHVRQDEKGKPSISILTHDRLRATIEQCCVMQTRNQRNEPRHTSVSKVVVSHILEWNDLTMFPVLEGVVEVPVIRVDGTILDIPGYDPQTQLIYHPDKKLNVPPIPVTPTRDDVENALAMLDEVIGEFPFVDDASKANTLAMLITPLARHIIDGCVPLFNVSATTVGTGKGLLVQAHSTISTGRKPALTTAVYNDDEWRKRITAMLSTGATNVVIDDVQGRLKAPSLDALLTSRVWTDRKMGSNDQVVEYPNNSVWIATGNNIQIGGDLPRRCVWIRLDAQMAKAFTRKDFKHDLTKWVPEHRGELVAAILTLLRYWFVQGKPKGNVPTMGSFEEWATTIGSVLECAGVDGFLQTIDEDFDQANDEAVEWGLFIDALYEWTGERPFQVKHIVEQVVLDVKEEETPNYVTQLSHACPIELPTKHGGKLQEFKRNMGYKLQHNKNRRVSDDGYYIKEVGRDSRNKTPIYKLVPNKA